MKVLHIGDNDLISRRFNGFDWRGDLLAAGIESELLVVDKRSDESFVHAWEKLDEDFTRSIVKNEAFANADVIHLHLIHNTPFDLNQLPLISRLKPVLLHMHDPFWIGGHCVHHLSCDRWRARCGDCVRLDLPFPRPFDDTALYFAAKKLAIQNSDISAVGMSRWIAGIAAKSPIWAGKKIYCTDGVGIDQSIFFPPESKAEAKRALGIDPGVTVLLFRANDKNPFKRLDAIRGALRSLPDSAKIAVIAVDIKGLLAEFEGRFQVLDLGWVQDAEKMASLYRAADIFMLPSLAETSNMSAPEAMSSGVVPLVSDEASVSASANAPECGVAASAGEYAAALARLVENPAEVARRGLKSLEYAREHYDQKKFAARLAAIYREAAGAFVRRAENQFVIDQILKYNADYRRYFRAEAMRKMREKILKKGG